MTWSAPVAVFSVWTVTPEAKPGRAIRFQPAQRWTAEVPARKPSATAESDAVPLSQKPRPAGNRNVVPSVGSAEDQAKPVAHASYDHASAHARPAMTSPKTGSVRDTGIPSRFSPARKGMRTLTARVVEFATLFAASTFSIR